MFCQFHPTLASDASSKSDQASYCAARPRVQWPPLIEELPPSVFPLSEAWTKSTLTLVRYISQACYLLLLTHAWFYLGQSAKPSQATTRMLFHNCKYRRYASLLCHRFLPRLEERSYSYPLRALQRQLSQSDHPRPINHMQGNEYPNKIS